MTKEPLISIVMPVYNGEKYLPETIGSIFAQTYKNFEVLCIDDISTDSSLTMLKSVASKDSRFRVYERETKGGNAVKGISYALPLCGGDWYFYMSQDDLIDPDFLEKSIKKAQENNPDIVICNTYLLKDGKKTKHDKYPLNNDYDALMNQKEAFLESLDWSFAGGGLRKMSLVKKFPFDDRYYNSDEFHTRKMYLYAEKIVFTDTGFYYVQDNPDALTKIIKAQSFDVLTTDIMLFGLLREHKFDERVIRKQLRKTIAKVMSFKRKYKRNSNKFSPEERKYILETIKAGENKLDLAASELNYTDCKLMLFFEKLYLKSIFKEVK